MTLIADVFTKLLTAKDAVRQRSKKHPFRSPLSQQVKGSQTLAESPRQHFYHIFHHSEGN